MNKCIVFNNAFGRELRELKEQLSYVKEHKVKSDDLKKIVLYGVKAMILSPKPTNEKGLKNEFYLYCYIKNVIAFLTPNEFMSIFPISKVYDGERSGLKDYFYTMDYLQQLNRDEPIGDKVLEFLMEYTNDHIHRFNTLGVRLVSDLRRLEGHLSIAEEFLASNGMETPNTFKNQKGDVLYIRKGRPVKLKKIHGLRLVK